MSIQGFADSALRRFFCEGRVPRRAGWSGVARVARRKLDMLDYAHALKDLASPPGNRLERLKGDLIGYHSVRINDQWRVVFRWGEAGPMKFESSTTTKDEPMKRQREPTSPGEILKEEFLAPLGMTQKELADHIGCDIKVINRIVNGHTSVTTEMALKLGAAFATSPEFWLNSQRAVDLWAAEQVIELPEPILGVA